MFFDFILYLSYLLITINTILPLIKDFLSFLNYTLNPLNRYLMFLIIRISFNYLLLVIEIISNLFSLWYKDRIFLFFDSQLNSYLIIKSNLLLKISLVILQNPPQAPITLFLIKSMPIRYNLHSWKNPHPIQTNSFKLFSLLASNQNIFNKHAPLIFRKTNFKSIIIIALNFTNL